MDSEWKEHDAMTHALGDALPVGSSWEKRTPARVGDLRGDLLLPLGQSVVTGVAAGVIAWGVGINPIVGVVVFGVAWVLLLVQTRAGLWTIERVTGQDLDDDDIVGEPPQVGGLAPLPNTVRVELSERHNGGSRTRFLDLPVTDAKLRDVAHAVKDGAPFSRRGLADVLSQEQYAKLSSAMLDAGLLHDVGNKRVLSAAGRVLLRKVAGT